MLAQRVAGAGRRRHRRARPARRRLPGRDDRPFRPRRAPPLVRYLQLGMTAASNIFGDFRRLVLAALDRLTAEGTLPKGLDFSRVAVEPPRDPAHGDLATNAAMVLAGQAKQTPMALAEQIAAALADQELASGDYRGRGFTVAAARPGFLNIRLDPAVWHAQLRAVLQTGAAYGVS